MGEPTHATVEGTDLPLKMPIASLDDLALPKSLLANCTELKPSTLESYTGPVVLDGRDLALVGAAPTGAEQVRPLLLPLIGRLLLDERPVPPPADGESKGACRPRGLVLAPTRSLAAFASDLARELTRGSSFRVARACGGVTIDASVAECTEGAALDMLVATPGRLLDLLDRGAVALGAVRQLLLVGVDTQFDAGYAEHLRRAVMDEGLPPLAERQTLLSCASMPPAVSRVVTHLVRANHVKVSAPKPWLAAASAPLARQSVHFTDERGKQPALAALLAASAVGGSGAASSAARSAPYAGLALVIVASRRHAEMVSYYLQGGVCSARSVANARRGSKTPPALAVFGGALSLRAVFDSRVVEQRATRWACWRPIRRSGPRRRRRSRASSRGRRAYSSRRTRRCELCQSSCLRSAMSSRLTSRLIWESMRRVSRTRHAAGTPDASRPLSTTPRQRSRSSYSQSSYNRLATRCHAG